MITNAIAGKQLPVYGNGLNIRDWLYVRDHCDAIQTVSMLVDQVKHITLEGIMRYQTLK